MGSGASCVPNRAALTSSKIDLYLEKDRQDDEKMIKLLLLGAAESGKSTILKQLRIIHHGSLNIGECRKYRPVVYCNTLQIIFSILNAMKNLEIQFANPDRVLDHRTLIEITENMIEKEITCELGKIITRLWNDEGVQYCFSRSREYQLLDSAEYFMNSLGRTSIPNYTPTQEDVLKTQIPTTGIVQSQFEYRGLTFKLFDVGGQRSERKKWLHCFDDVNAIIFVAALSAYDLVLREKKGVNRMAESMRLFESICNNKWFVDTSIILFLNKKDLLMEKISKSPLSICFPKYPGQNNYHEASFFISRQFNGLSLNQNSKEIYTHFTCATDTNNIQLVFKDVSHVIINQVCCEAKLL